MKGGSKKFVVAVLVIVVALAVYHMAVQHQGQGILPNGLGTK